MRINRAIISEFILITSLSLIIISKVSTSCHILYFNPLALYNRRCSFLSYIIFRLSGRVHEVHCSRLLGFALSSLNRNALSPDFSRALMCVEYGGLYRGRKCQQTSPSSLMLIKPMLAFTKSSR